MTVMTKALGRRIERVRGELKRRDQELVSVRFGRAAVPGTFTIELCHADFPMPLGIVWFGYSGNETINVYNSFVFEWFRRCGVRSLLHESMLEYCPTIQSITSAGSTTGGRAWMQATGYRRNRDRWEFKRKKPRRKRRSK